MSASALLFAYLAFGGGDLREKNGKCHGAYLKKIGFADGARCDTADFDGDGAVDFWVFRCKENFIDCEAKVILTKGGAASKVVNVPRMEMPMVWRVRGKNEELPTLKELGCTLPKNDALVEVGDGDGRENRVYELNRKAGVFKKISACITEELGD